MSDQVKPIKVMGFFTSPLSGQSERVPYLVGVFQTTFLPLLKWFEEM